MKYNIQAEINILGAILNKNDLICDALNILVAGDFYDNRHKLIFDSMRQMYESSKKIDTVTLAEYIGKNLKDAGGITYLSQLMASTLETNIKPYIEIVKEKSVLRNLEIDLNKALKRISNDEFSEEIIDFLQQKTLNVKINNNEDGNITNALENFLDDLELRYKNGGEIQGIKTCIEKLDYVLGGLHKQELVIIAGRPSMGKSVLATNFGQNIALKSNKKVAIFSLEMSNMGLLKRMVSNLTSIDSYNLRDGNLTDKQWRDITRATGLLNTKNLKLFEKTMSLNGICNTCKKLKIQNGLDVVIIDYLQLIEDAKKSSNRTEEVSHISRRLKLLAKELDITVVALSQLSRAPENRSDHRPTLSDLRESGSIEQDADVVIFLYRDEYYNRETEEKNIIELIVAKQRDGVLRIVKCVWMPQFQRIANLDYVHDGYYNPKIFENKDTYKQESFTK